MDARACTQCPGIVVTWPASHVSGQSGGQVAQAVQDLEARTHHLPDHWQVEPAGVILQRNPVDRQLHPVPHYQVVRYAIRPNGEPARIAAQLPGYGRTRRWFTPGMAQVYADALNASR